MRTYLPTYLPTYLHTYIPTYLHTYINTYNYITERECAELTCRLSDLHIHNNHHILSDDNQHDVLKAGKRTGVELAGCFFKLSFGLDDFEINHLGEDSQILKHGPP